MENRPRDNEPNYDVAIFQMMLYYKTVAETQHEQLEMLRKQLKRAERQASMWFRNALNAEAEVRQLEQDQAQDQVYNEAVDTLLQQMFARLPGASDYIQRFNDILTERALEANETLQFAQNDVEIIDLTSDNDE